jgi:hypothetical protein
MVTENTESKPHEVEGIKAQQAREQRENLIKMFGNVGDQHELIVIVKDLSGEKPDQVHVQGPMHDRVLLYGMLEIARDVVALSFQKKQN